MTKVYTKEELSHIVRSKKLPVPPKCKFAARMLQKGNLIGIFEDEVKEGLCFQPIVWPNQIDTPLHDRLVLIYVKPFNTIGLTAIPTRNGSKQYKIPYSESNNWMHLIYDENVKPIQVVESDVTEKPKRIRATRKTVYNSTTNSMKVVEAYDFNKALEDDLPLSKMSLRQKICADNLYPKSGTKWLDELIQEIREDKSI